MKKVLEFLRDLRDAALVVAFLAVPLGAVAKWAIAQEVTKQQKPVVRYIEKDVQLKRESIVIAEWSACMQYATTYAEGHERQQRCDSEREYRWKVWWYNDCREEGGGDSCVKPEPEISPATRRE
jgi:hypothetical protein